MCRGLFISGTIILLLSGCSSKPGLSSSEKATWDNFINKQLDTGMVQPNTQEAGAVAAMGDKIVPYVVENLGKAYTGPGGKGDYWLVIVLARVGSPKAVDGILKVLKHDYPGKISLDREVAASALVWLGESRAIPELEAALADTQKQIDEKLSKEKAEGAGKKKIEFHTFEYGQWAKPLKTALDQLKQGKGKRDTKNFPFN